MVTPENFLGPFRPVKGAGFEFFQVESRVPLSWFFRGAEHIPALEQIQAPRSLTSGDVHIVCQ